MNFLLPNSNHLSPSERQIRAFVQLHCTVLYAVLLFPFVHGVAIQYCVLSHFWRTLDLCFDQSPHHFGFKIRRNQLRAKILFDRNRTWICWSILVPHTFNNMLYTHRGTRKGSSFSDRQKRCSLITHKHLRENAVKTRMERVSLETRTTVTSNTS